jgi:hypothetical protein
MNNFIDDPGKILSFLKRLRASNISIDVIYQNKKTRGIVRYVGEFSFEIYCLTKIEIDKPEIEIEFNFESKVYHFATEILNQKDTTLLLMLPARINIWAQRKYPRKNVYNQAFVSISFIKPVEYSSDLPQIEGVSENLKDIKSELDKDVPDLKRIVSMILREISKMSDDYDFVFYKRGMTLPSSAIISRLFRKPLLVEDTTNLESYITTYENFNIVTYGDYMKKANWDDSKVVDQIKKLRATFVSQNTRSFACVPVRVKNDIIGFIFCRKSNGRFIIRDILYLDALSYIISEAYIKGKINSLKNSRELKLPIIDIGGGGLRFEIDGIIGKLIKPDDVLRMFIEVYNKNLQTIGKVIRIDTTKSKNKLWIACQFTYISSEDQQFLVSLASS